MLLLVWSQKITFMNLHDDPLTLQISMNVTAILVTTPAPTMKAHLCVGVMKDTDWKEAQPAMVCHTVLLGVAVARLAVYS